MPQPATTPFGGRTGGHRRVGSGGLDRRQAAEAYKKVPDGQELTDREQTALKRFEKEKEERLRWHYYNRSTQTGLVVRQIGEGYHVNWLQSEWLKLVEIDADHWKTWRLVSPLDSQRAMTQFEATPHYHLALAKHLTS